MMVQGLVGFAEMLPTMILQNEAVIDALGIQIAGAELMVPGVRTGEDVQTSDAG